LEQLLDIPMITLSLTEIRDRAQVFATEWKGETRENAEAKSFWDGFFNVFGRTRREVASFEDPVKKLEGVGKHFIDLLWKGMLIAEHKSAGKDLGEAESQAMNYIQELISSNRASEVPRYLIVSDFERIALHDLDANSHLEIKLEDLTKNVEAFGFIAGMRQDEIKPQDPVNIEATEKMADLHDALLEGGYPADDLDKLLTRILFCLYAEDTQIFEVNQFESLILNHTKDDGSDLGLHLGQLFSVLNTPENARQTTIGEQYLEFPYVNGNLFADSLLPAGTNREMRDTLVAAADLDWSRISPAIFGSMFQGVMEAEERRDLGAHYTREADILKVINPLFMDELRDELPSIVALKKKAERLRRLRAFHDKLASLNFLDPACGCGNFLIIAYRELRALETEVIKQELKLTGQAEQTITDIELLTRVRVSQFHGIEVGHFPSEIARVAMWLMDHQANMHLSKEIGRYFLRLPLSDSANIATGNALVMEWGDVLPPGDCSYVFGNPPFSGSKYMTASQKVDMKMVAGAIKGFGLLDYVCGWYIKAADYIQGAGINCAFVSTNSISQGEQPFILWSRLIDRGIQIRFAHRTFAWNSEARGKAHVHVVIIGFGNTAEKTRAIYDYPDIAGDPVLSHVPRISPYLIEGPMLALPNRSKPICPVPSIGIGNKPIDGGYLLFTSEEKNEFVKAEPESSQFFRKWIGSKEFLNGYERWCLWLGDTPPAEWRKLPKVRARVESVAKYRRGEISAKGKEDTAKNKKRDAGTQKLAATPTKFHVENIPQNSYLVIPEVSSEKRTYTPIGYLGKESLASNLVKIIPEATLYEFGVLSSMMHMDWMRLVAGRLESRYRYSIGIVYNNFPWPLPTAPQKKAVERAAQAVLDSRATFPENSLADLYDPLAMPPSLVKAHNELDRMVDHCYRNSKFTSARKRVEHLFKLYEKFIAGL
jgi:hypothetical protein